MNGYSKFRENRDSHTVQTSPPPKTLKESSCQEIKKLDPICHKPDHIIVPPKEPNTMRRNESFAAFRRNHSTTSQRFAHNNSDLKNMMRRAFSTRKTYWRLEDDDGGGGIDDDFGHADHFVQEQDLDKNPDQARGNDSNNGEGKKKKKKAFKRLKKIFHF